MIYRKKKLKKRLKEKKKALLNWCEELGVYRVGLMLEIFQFSQITKKIKILFT